VLLLSLPESLVIPVLMSAAANDRLLRANASPLYGTINYAGVLTPPRARLLL
jgi:hypothetical protein